MSIIKEKSRRQRQESIDNIYNYKAAVNNYFSGIASGYFYKEHGYTRGSIPTEPLIKPFLKGLK